MIDKSKSYLETPTITTWSYTGQDVKEIKGEFKYKADALDHEGSVVWGHGTQGAMPQARGT